MCVCVYSYVMCVCVYSYDMFVCVYSQVSVKFRVNEAVLGSSLYASTFRACTWFSQHYPFFNPLSILEWPLWDLG